MLLYPKKLKKDNEISLYNEKSFCEISTREEASRRLLAKVVHEILRKDPATIGLRVVCLRRKRGVTTGFPKTFQCTFREDTFVKLIVSTRETFKHPCSIMA